MEALVYTFLLVGTLGVIFFAIFFRVVAEFSVDRRRLIAKLARGISVNYTSDSNEKLC
jgi:hypothetical protein